MAQTVKQFLNSKLGVTILYAIVSSVIMAAITVSAQQLFPKSPVVVQSSETTEDFNVTPLERLRTGYPPLIYKFQYAGESKGKSYGFFNLQSIPPQWVYLVTFANLSTVEVTDIHFHFASPTKHNFIYVRPFNCEMLFSPGETVPQKHYTQAGKQISRFITLIRKLTAGQAAGCMILIYDDNRPLIDSFTITLTCSEGNFMRITPRQWEMVGWQKTEN